jgi:Fe-S cluster assembly protein SufD
MTAVMEDKEVYLASFPRFEKGLPESEPAWLTSLRQAAIDRFAALGFPTLDDEEWRFTPLAALTRVPFELASASAPAIVPVRPRRLNGGVLVISLAEALAKHPELVQPHLARHAACEEHAFTALNTAFLRDGVFVYLPQNAVVGEPIVIDYFTSAGRPTVGHRRALIVAGPNSQAQLVERYRGKAGEVYFTNAVTEVVLGEGAIVDHCKLQQESTTAFHVHTLQVQQDRASNFTSHNIALGSQLARTDINVVLGAEGCECTLNGLYMAGGAQLIDNHTLIEHARPHCTSHELYKGILDGKARGVFRGKIHVHPDAQKTDAKQTNQTLLLSEDAIINTKPQLEIYADDVKCTHGATVGQLDAESLFYLRSRGIGKQEARALLTYAFANDIIQRIKDESLRDSLAKDLLQTAHLPPGEGE